MARELQGALGYAGASNLGTYGWVAGCEITSDQKDTPDADRRWPNSSPQHRQEPYSAQQAIAAMARAGVNRALIQPLLWDPHSNEPAQEAVRKYPNRSAIIGRLYLDDPNGRDLFAHWKERPGMLGLRFYFNERHKREWMTDGSLDWLWPAAERHLPG